MPGNKPEQRSVDLLIIKPGQPSELVRASGLSGQEFLESVHDALAMEISLGRVDVREINALLGL